VIRKIQGGTFDDGNHEYRTDAGVWVPSVTQIISLVRYSHFDNINPSVVENAARRGGNAHFLTEQYDAEGELPPPWAPEDELIRFGGYKEWKERENFVPESVELPLISSVYGMAFACTIDRVGMMGGRKTIVELKFTCAPPKTAGIQLAAQEIALTGSPTPGRYTRVVCHVDSRGKAKTIVHRDFQDAQRFIFALGVAYTRMDLGQNIREEIVKQ